MPGYILAGILVLHGKFQNRPIAQLAGVSALQLLPRGLAGRNGNRHFSAACGDLFIADQNVDAAFVQVDLNGIASLIATKWILRCTNSSTMRIT